MRKIKIKNEIPSYIIWGDSNKLLRKIRNEKKLLIFDRNASLGFVNGFRYALGLTEYQKNTSLFEKIINFFYKTKLNRKDIVVCAGGGLLSDVCGFATSVWMRGVDFIIIPTTLLSQIDASVGGKTAINFKDKKNLIGSFHFPKYVIIDPQLTLSQNYNDYIQAFGEIFKYIIISDEKTSRRIIDLIDGVIERKVKSIKNCSRLCVDFKLKIIEKDPFDKKGIREILNFGHTIAHALEMLSTIPHGDAVLCGCIFELMLSQKLGYIKKEKNQKFFELLRYRDVDEKIKNINFKRILEKIEYDKKNSSSKNSFLIITNRGIKKIVDVEDRILYEIWRRLCEKRYL